MKRFISITGILVLLIIFGYAQTSAQAQKESPMPPGQQTSKTEPLYTAYNIWIMAARNMDCINYKFGNNILPAGTKVQNVDIVLRKEGSINMHHISFLTVEGGKLFTIDFTQQWHPGKTIEDYKNYMFSNKNFEALTAGLSKEEIDAIRKGTVVDGMSRRAVLIAYGYPPQHQTPSLESRTWKYWRNKFGTFNVCFDENDRTMTCP